MINRQLIDYIKQQLQQSAPPEDIKKSLRASGWAEADIAQAFGSLATPRNDSSTNFSSKPKGVKVISVLCFLGSLSVLGIGILFIFGANMLAQIPEINFFNTSFAIIAIVFTIFLGILGIFLGVGLWKYKNWARWTMIASSLGGIIVALIYMVKGSVAGNIFNVAVNSIAGGYLLFSPKVKAAFEPEKDIVSLNKKMVWASIVLLFFITGLAGVFGSQITPAATLPPIHTPSVSLPVIIPNPTSIPAQAEKSQTLSPKDSWLKMKAEFNTVKHYNDFYAYTLKYGSKTQLAKIKASRKQIDALPQSFKDQIAALARVPLLSEIKSIQETIHGNTATLNVQTTKPGLSGVITLAREDNQWKLERENWTQR